MAHLRRCVDLSVATAAVLVGSLLHSSNLQAQNFKHSITTISPPPAETPDPARADRHRRNNTVLPAPTPANGLKSASGLPLRRTFGAQSANQSGHLLPVEPEDRTRDGNASHTVSSSSAVTLDNSWRSPEGVSLPPTNSNLRKDGPRSDNRVDDPYLSSIDVSPRLELRRRQRHRYEPYAATGVRLGSFIVLPEIEFGLAWSSNVFNSPSSRSDHAYTLRPAVRAVSNWRRHAVEFRGRSNLSFYDDFRSEDDRTHQVEARGRLDITRRMNFEGLLSHSTTQETRGGADSTAGASGRADQTTNVAAVTFNRRFNRLSIQLRGLLTDFDAAEAISATGGLINNDDQDYRELLGALRLAWEFKSTLSVFSEVSAGEREHDQVAQTDGFSRSSNIRRYRAGVTTGNSRSIWSGELAIGYGKNDLHDARLSDVSGILVDGNVVWRPTALTSLLFTMQSDLAATRLAGSGASRDYIGSLEVRHAFRPNIISTTGISYGLRNFDNSSLEEATWLLTGGLEYFLSRNASVFGRYQHEQFDTNAGNGDYRDNTINVGLRLRR